MPFIQDLSPLCNPFVATATSPHRLDIDLDVDSGHTTGAPHLKLSSSSPPAIPASATSSATHHTISTTGNLPPPTSSSSSDHLAPAPSISASPPTIALSSSPTTFSSPSSTMGGTYYHTPDDNSGEAPLNPAYNITSSRNEPNPNIDNNSTAPLSLSSPASASSTSVAQALEIARDSAEGAADPVVSGILESTLAHIWRKVLAQPEAYVMSRDEFAVFNYFQARFVGNVVAMEARKRFWDNTRGGA